jgi:hypothetical protein
MTKYLGFVLVGALLAFGAGCSSSDGGGGGTGGGTGGTAGTGNSGGGGGLDPNPCQAAGGSGEVEITVEEIRQDTTFEAACTYVLTRETYVIDATITIEAGTTFLGERQSALVITSSGAINAVGTADDPIVFTSSALESDAAPGDWGGVVLLGLARLSWGDTPCDGEAGECVGSIEGISPNNPRGAFGGDDDTHNCGTLRYVRIEYAGSVFGDDNELNGLTVGGCGSDTELSYIQVHRGLDDGVEFFGGTAPIDHVIVTGAGDDGLDWDQGYRGTIQYFIVHHFASTSSSPNGIEADNFGDGDNNVEPRSAPDLMMGTIIGDNRPAGSGIVTRVGTWATISGAAVVGFGGAGYDMRNGAWSVEGGWPAGIFVDDSCFDDNGINFPVDSEDCSANDADDCNDESDVTADEYFAEDTELTDAARGNAEVDPQLGDVSGACDDESIPDYSLSNPDCAGAFASDGDWTVGWTAFPTGVFNTSNCP